jgi:peptidoglycan/xylan/chitin deacetylase (PgdA/CDA1 family)
VITQVREPLFDAMSFLDGGVEDSVRSRWLNAYYATKPFVPSGLRLAARRLYARRQATRSFPAWPIEPARVDQLHDRIRGQLLATGSEELSFINFWPDRKRFALILTHDVEGPRGIEAIRPVLEVERRHGMVSSWNFVAGDYPIPPGLFADLRAAGCEIGLHSVSHDGSLFRSRADFERQLPAIERYMSEWGAVGFRSPATHRNADWMPELGCLYDSSFPDTDPFEPQPGGCCSIWPYFLDELVELPITMTQDHTLFEILRESTIGLWVKKSDWLIEQHGLVNVLVHPDYMLSAERLELYDELLTRLGSRPDGWHALPREVAEWWRIRASLERGTNISEDTGELAERASIARARMDGDRIALEV